MAKGLRYSTQTAMFGSKEIIGYGEDDWYVEEIDRIAANHIIRTNHYSKKVYAATYIHLGVYIRGELLGVLQYGYALNPASCKSVVEGTELNQYLELNRMWLDDKAKRNSETKAISYSIKYIRSKFPRIKWIQSFADERCTCFGIVYQAASFNYYGEHTSIFYELDGEIYHKIQFTVTEKDKRYNSVKHLIARKDEAIKHSLRQFRYIKFIDQRWKDKCLLKEKPYPKYYNGD